MQKKIYSIFHTIQIWMDRITTAVAAVLIAVMFIVIIANVVLRAIPAVGGFRWYMEFSQYARTERCQLGQPNVKQECRQDAIEITPY